MLALEVQKDFRWNGVLYKKGEIFSPRNGEKKPTPSEVDRLLKNNFIFVNYFADPDNKTVSGNSQVEKTEKVETKVSLEKISDPKKDKERIPKKDEE